MWLPSNVILAGFTQSKGTPPPSDPPYSVSAVQAVSALSTFSGIFLSSLVCSVFSRVMIEGACLKKVSKLYLQTANQNPLTWSPGICKPPGNTSTLCFETDTSYMFKYYCSQEPNYLK